MTTDIKPGKYVQFFNCYVILPSKKDRPETGHDGRLNYKICDRVVSVNPFAACLVEHDMPESVGYFKSPKDAYSYLKSVEGENFEDQRAEMNKELKKLLANDLEYKEAMEERKKILKEYISICDDFIVCCVKIPHLQCGICSNTINIIDASQNYNFCISNILTKYKQATTHRKQGQTVSMDYRSCNQEVRRIIQCKTESQSLEMNHTQQDTHCKRSYKTSENMQNIKYIPWEARKSTPMEIVYNALNKVFYLVK